jgi:hypothetical protein
MQNKQKWKLLRYIHCGIGMSTPLQSGLSFWTRNEERPGHQPRAFLKTCFTIPTLRLLNLFRATAPLDPPWRRVRPYTNLPPFQSSSLPPFQISYRPSRFSCLTTIPCASTTSTTIGIWPSACVEQERQGSWARMAASTRFNNPSVISWPAVM